MIPYDGDPRYDDLPVNFHEWTDRAQIEYLRLSYTRDKLFLAIVLEVELDEIDPDSVHVRKRFNKEELAKIVFALDAFGKQQNLSRNP